MILPLESLACTTGPRGMKSPVRLIASSSEPSITTQINDEALNTFALQARDKSARPLGRALGSSAVLHVRIERGKRNPTDTNRLPLWPPRSSTSAFAS